VAGCWLRCLAAVVFAVAPVAAARAGQVGGAEVRAVEVVEHEVLRSVLPRPRRVLLALALEGALGESTCLSP
jgi:hypothetical protein